MHPLRCLVWQDLVFPPINLYNLPYMKTEDPFISDHEKAISKVMDNGLTTDCYDVPENAKTLDDLIEHKNMPFWLATIFKVCYAYNERSERNASASKRREMNKILYYSDRGNKKLIKEENK